jgi:hypothetical protein
MIRMRLVAVLTALLLFPASGAIAQDRVERSFIPDVFARVVLDPTTYAPAVLAYDSTMRDWRTSQPFFQHGFNESNARFTVSGLPNDVAISYGAGQRIIRGDALESLRRSAVNNLAEQIIERVLVNKYPNHRKLVRAVGWAQRISFASFKAYRLSAPHYRQAGQNQRLAEQLGFE